MQWSAILAGLYFTIRLVCLRQRQLFRQSHQTIEFWPILLETRQVHLRQFNRRNFSRVYRLGELRNGGESQVFSRTKLWDLDFA